MFLASALVAEPLRAASSTAPADAEKEPLRAPLVLNRSDCLKTSKHDKSIDFEIRALARRTLGTLAVVRRQPNRRTGAGNGLDRGDELTRSTSPRAAKPGY
ncbi:MAG TPA: hypothetical protein VMV21_13455 [Vicinamibacteria bacterium]|nr:hypothetical protein [Vicinamibacteria bacterium]